MNSSLTRPFLGAYDNHGTHVGVAYCNYVPKLVEKEPGLIDYVEIPFEMLIRNARPSELSKYVPIVLHCASLSIAGNAPPTGELWSKLDHWISETDTPWLGEHLAFVRSTESPDEPAMHDALIVNEETGAYDVGYTVSPQYSPEVLDRVVRTLELAEKRFGLPVLLENGPIYVSLPGSTMSQIEFINALCERLPSTKLLLDLSHLDITSRNLNIDPFELLEQFPVEKVVEVHLSGHSEQSGMFWDDHSARASQLLFDLLSELMVRSQPRAITLEYNWDSEFPLDGLREDLAKVREITAYA